MYGDYNMNEYVNILVKTFILYFFLIFVLRLMGKREIGELSLFDVAVIFIISEILSISITNSERSILFSILPIFVIVVLEIVVSKLCYKFEAIRNLINGKSEIIIIHGVLNIELMKKERYNINDVINQLHDQNIATPKEVKFAILESNGKIRAFKNDSPIKWPEPIIQDGKIKKEVIKKLNINLEKLYKEINKRGYNDIKNILLCYLLEDDLYIQEKIFFYKNRINNNDK